MRAEAAALVLLMAVPLAAPLIVVRCRESASARPGWQAILLFGVAALGTAGLSGVDWLLYARAPGYEDFRESNWLRARLTEYLPSARVTPGTLARIQKEVGWSPNDVRMLREWWVTDRALFSTDKLRRAVATLDVSSGPDKVATRAQSASTFRMPGGLGQMWPSLLVLGALLLRRPSREGALYLVFSTLVVVGTATLLELLLKPIPARVLGGVLLLQAAFVTLAVARWGRRPPYAASVLGALVLVVTVATGVSGAQPRICTPGRTDERGQGGCRGHDGGGTVASRAAGDRIPVRGLLASVPQEPHPVRLHRARSERTDASGPTLPGGHGTSGPAPAPSAGSPLCVS